MQQQQVQILDFENRSRSVVVDQRFKSDIHYVIRFMIYATLPLIDPHSSTYQVNNGRYQLFMNNLRGDGLPYGRYPRLFLIWLATEAVRQKTPEIELPRNLKDLMSDLNIRVTGGVRGNISRFKNQILRLASTTFLLTNIPNAEYEMQQKLDLIDGLFMNNVNSIFNEGQIRLSDKFYNEIISSPVPVYFKAIKSFSSVLAIDVYIWLTYRMFSLNTSVSIRWLDLQCQFSTVCNYRGNGSRSLERFRVHFLEALETVKSVYSDVNYEVKRGRLVLHPSQTHVISLRPGRRQVKN